MLPQVGHGLDDERRATWCGSGFGDSPVSRVDTVPAIGMSFCRLTIDCHLFPWAHLAQYRVSTHSYMLIKLYSQSTRQHWTDWDGG
jgi:hypothetical protein